MAICPGKYTCITLLEDGTLDVNEEDGHNFLSIATGHESAEERWISHARWTANRYNYPYTAYNPQRSEHWSSVIL